MGVNWSVENPMRLITLSPSNWRDCQLLILSLTTTQYWSTDSMSILTWVPHQRECRPWPSSELPLCPWLPRWPGVQSPRGSRRLCDSTEGRVDCLAPPQAHYSSWWYQHQSWALHVSKWLLFMSVEVDRSIILLYIIQTIDLCDCQNTMLKQCMYVRSWAGSYIEIHT